MIGNYVIQNYFYSVDGDVSILSDQNSWTKISYCLSHIST
ncbi:hypothetical protein IC006_0410 [Sulfuracidifex tepidarius]|uniref:Uncharacterized protein n=1 Tax=Sulfuracidifex tepidarius TaxID=1294262 RepID=A0A510DSG0_9CREN|nr:hypothetical protein IC006_0410 [Sulfuracidifex tepidarius]